ncbi:hypothetical protein L596_023167 [Steinernema carpocapsae]|uniref:Uncharacterized protein n=1 Tax=Steinernema carpocapsae TaxID=34508 RepID=A0A4V5ZZB5_STECR|nr:hypothetical protein L596_023167 [Steinernema carpocapsae]
MAFLKCTIFLMYLFVNIAIYLLVRKTDERNLQTTLTIATGGLNILVIIAVAAYCVKKPLQDVESNKTLITFA